MIPPTLLPMSRACSGPAERLATGVGVAPEQGRTPAGHKSSRGRSAGGKLRRYLDSRPPVGRIFYHWFKCFPRGASLAAPDARDVPSFRSDVRPGATDTATEARGLARILIPTYSGDIHAVAVGIALKRKGHEPVLWYSADFPTRQRGSIYISEQGYHWQFSGPELNEIDGHFDVVWFRRPGLPLLPDDLHPGDRKVAQNACDAFYRSVWQFLAPDAFWVNPLQTRMRADSKPIQLIEARRLGLKIPPTLCTNDPDAIRSFLARREEGDSVYKSFVPAKWKTEQGVALLYTSDISIHALPEDDLLQISAGIFQRKIPKQYELRVTYIGDRPFAVKIFSQESEQAKLDWRRAHTSLRIEGVTLPEDVDRRCRDLMKSLGIVFGCFDFIVTPEEEYYFLEVNPMGQFLWVEEGAPDLLLLDAFCEFLVQRSVSFSWQASSESLRFGDLRTEVEEQTKQAKRLHVITPDRRVASDQPPREQSGEPVDRTG
jgi:glutathione synthase/RimK-type ligase-like ATP-grasp enzyme